MPEKHNQRKTTRNRNAYQLQVLLLDGLTGQVAVKERDGEHHRLHFEGAPLPGPVVLVLVVEAIVRDFLDPHDDFA